MRLSIETYVLHKRYGDEKAIKMLKNAGFDSVDYSYNWLKEDDETLGENYVAYAHKLKRLLDENGMVCNQAHAPFSVVYGSSFDKTDKNYEQIVRSMESAAIIGAKYIVIHSLKVPEGVDVFDYNLQYYKSFQPYCEKFKIAVAIENLPNYGARIGEFYPGRLHTPELLYKMLDALQSPWFVVCADTGHAGITGVEPQDLIRGLDRDVLKVIHVHDNDYVTDKHMLPFMGKFDWEKIMQALKDIDYAGDFNLELPYFLDKFSDDLIEDALAFAAKVGRKLIRMA